MKSSKPKLEVKEQPQALIEAFTPPPPASQPNLNVALLLKIKAKILKNPKHFRMDVFSCGTAACIAGWAVILADGKKIKGAKSLLDKIRADGGVQAQSYFASSKASEVLGLSRKYWTANLMNYLCWPQPYRNNYDTATTLKEKAQIAADRIDHLIATGE